MWLALDPGYTEADMRCQVVIVSLSVFLIFASNNIPFELLDVHEFK